MLTNEQIQLRITEIKSIASDLKWSHVQAAQEALVNAEALEELLSLRGQLEAIKSQKPSYWLDVHGYQTYLYFNEKDATKACDKNGGLYVKAVYDEPTAAKPEALPRHIFSMLVNELRDVPAIGCKRQLIIGVLNRHGITAEPVQFDPPAAK
ncbi:TPA: polyphosphate kinase [Yersinia enterocolitica]